MFNPISYAQNAARSRSPVNAVVVQLTALGSIAVEALVEQTSTTRGSRVSRRANVNVRRGAGQMVAMLVHVSLESVANSHTHMGHQYRQAGPCVRSVGPTRGPADVVAVLLVVLGSRTVEDSATQMLVTDGLTA